MTLRRLIMDTKTVLEPTTEKVWARVASLRTAGWVPSGKLHTFGYLWALDLVRYAWLEDGRPGDGRPGGLAYCVVPDAATPKPRCPRCDGILRVRSGRRGEFWGCENYPDCRFTRNLATLVVAKSGGEQ